MSEYKVFASKLVDWYQLNKRDLPWRHTSDPYKIWLSEIILQQTRVDQGMNYYLKFVRNYPTVNDLAKAEESEVLRLWQGLGYYSRARNLHRSSKYIVEELKGEFPNTYLSLLQLKGVGDYTASAISSFAFNEKQAVVDGNVYRVLSRVFGITDDISSSHGPKVFREFAQKIIPKNNPGEYNQAIMEFGSIHCTPKNPNCTDCIFQSSCIANKSNLQNELPVKSKKVKSRDRYFNYLVIEHGNKFILNKRLDKDVWEGLYDFPLLESSSEITAINNLLDMLTDNLAINEGHFISCHIMPKHILSHQKIFSRFWYFKVSKQTPNTQNNSYYSISEIKNLPKPVLIDKYLNESIF